ncbi:MAG: RnfABCDGE type electron transport complex subunit B [Gammaproteobacteria bacterium]
MLYTTRALINPDQCIGCARCIKVCPVDAIIGAPKKMHQILSSYCTGCEDCVAACPVDCITMLPVEYSAAERAIREKIGDARTEEVTARKHQKQLEKNSPPVDTTITNDLAQILARVKIKRLSSASNRTER